MNILIIDSDQRAADGLAGMLAAWGHIPVVATEIDAALAVSKQSVFEVVIMDLMINAEPAYPIIPDLKLYNCGVSVITMTGNSTPELEKKARERGISFYMGKPVDKELIKQILDHLSVFHGSEGKWKKVTLF